MIIFKHSGAVDYGATVHSELQRLGYVRAEDLTMLLQNVNVVQPNGKPVTQAFVQVWLRRVGKPHNGYWHV